MNEQKLIKICMNIYRDMYRKSTPKADIDELIKSGETKRDGWFMNYYLPEDVLHEILERHIAKYKLNDVEKSSIRSSILLGGSPTSAYLVWQKKNKIEKWYYGNGREDYLHVKK